MAFFLKTNDKILLLQNLAVIWTKQRHFFAKLFGEIIFLNHNIGPSSDQKSHHRNVVVVEIVGDSPDVFLVNVVPSVVKV
jgi:hypothetical protein